MGTMNILINCDEFRQFALNTIGGCPRSVMVKAMDCGIVVREYYVHFRANTLGKGMNPLILPAMGLALNNLKRVDMPLNKETKPNLNTIRQAT